MPGLKEGLTFKPAPPAPPVEFDALDPTAPAPPPPPAPLVGDGDGLFFPPLFPSGGSKPPALPDPPTLHCDPWLAPPEPDPPGVPTPHEAPPPAGELTPLAPPPPDEE